MTDRERFIVLLDSERPRESDAIILLEGDGYARYKEAASLFKAGIAPVICFSGNLDNGKSGAFTFDRIKPLILAEGVPETALLFEDKSRNTYEQAVQVIGLAQKKGWKRITIVASHYHAYRAFLTFLCVQKTELPDLVMDMASVKGLDWYEETGWGRRIDLLESEFEKIDAYQKKDNVASYKAGIEYLEWKSSRQRKY